MPAPEPYADHKKAELIANVSALPDGIQYFLETEIPTIPTIGTPGDVDGAIIASGVLSKVMLDVIKRFEGYTPIAALMHLAQLNDWNIAGVLTGMQKWQGAVDGEEGEGEEELGDFEIVSPQEGVAYQPGGMRFEVRATRGTLKSCDAQVMGGSGYPPFDLKAENGSFWGMFYLRDEGSFSVSVDGSFSDDRPTVTKNRTFIIDAEADQSPANGGKDDLTGLDLLKKVFNDACQRVISGVGSLGEVIAAARNLRRAGGASGGGGASGSWGARADATIEELLQEGEPT